MKDKMQQNPANGSETAATEFDVVIIGAGFSGLEALHNLRGCGLSVKIFEAGGGVGGTWYWNRYPGARVDVQSMEYSFAFSEELQQEWKWTERYASQPELLRYLDHVADRFDLRRDIQLNTRVAAATFDESKIQWVVRTDRNDHVRAKFIVIATGGLSAANKPKFKGADTFKGKQYQTALWPHEGVDFTGQRVGIIGTGSSGIQCIQEVAKQAAHLTVFQRTANFAVPSCNVPMDSEFEQIVKANYASVREYERNSVLGTVIVDSKITDGQATEVSALAVTPEERRSRYEFLWKSANFSLYNAYSDLLTNKEANDTLADFFRAKIRERVRDPAVAELLCPKDHPVMTKRICSESGYYETFNRDNVSLVDVKSSPIEAITPDGLVVGGVEHKLDSLIYATGFDAGTGAMTRMDIRGRSDRSLRQEWNEGGARTNFGFMSNGYPNLFMIVGPTSPAVSFFIPVVQSHVQVQWIADCIRYLDKHNYACMEPTVEAETEWRAHVNEVANDTLIPQTNSWYMGANVEGKPRSVVGYLGGFTTYTKKYNDAVAKGYDGFLLTPRGPDATLLPGQEEDALIASK